MTQIERRQARIRRIRAQLDTEGNPKIVLEVETGTSSDNRYHIGKTQNQPEHIISFIQQNTGDPAIKVSCCFSNCKIRTDIFKLLALHPPAERTSPAPNSSYAQDHN